MMLKPHPLTPGDRVAIVAPASPFVREELDRGIDELRRLGFEPVYDESVFTRRAYVVGPAEDRAAAILSAWRDPSIAGIIGARGGYGSVQVLPFLERDTVRSGRKVFIGYSDLTSILTFLTIGCGLVAFHGPMVAGQLARGSSGYEPASLLNAVSRAEPLGELTPDGIEMIHPGKSTGPLFGGTLTQILGSLGTPHAFTPPAGYVLFLDEFRERPYRLDRMMVQLRQSGLLGKAAAIVIGELPECDEPDGGATARGVMADALRDFRGPVVAGFPSGHAVHPSITLPLGVSCSVIAGATPRLVIEESAVE
jgi:muramoyltetrapeptide carboxypeptidase